MDEGSTGSDEAQAVVGGRYDLRELLGSGGAGTVYAAHDRVTGETVAVKLLESALTTADQARFRREVMALRLLRVRGVVRMIDDGVHRGRPFIVMEKIDGQPFPGDGPRSWSAIGPICRETLEVLSHVHAYGVVHRDIKPSNVMVDSSGRPTLLDFGLARRLHDSSVTSSNAVVGSPAYLAPEQIRNGPLTPQTDLYAFGVMLFEALAGQRPHHGSDWPSIVRAKLMRAPRPLQELAPDVPPHVASTIERLLRRDPDERPSSAAETLYLLGLADMRPDTVLPWLGSRAPIDGLVHAARARRSAGLAGASGSGRSRCLSEAVSTLEREGVTVRATVRATIPFASLASFVDTRQLPAASIEEAMRLVRDRVHHALAAGTVIVADDWEHLDRWSRDVLETELESGCVLRTAEDGDVRVSPLGVEDLRALFAGSERVLHLPSDWAELLFARTRGHPKAVAAEVMGWTQRGHATLQHGRLHVDRVTLERLAVAMEPAAVSDAPLDLTPLSDGLRELLAWIELAQGSATVEILASCLERATWIVDGQLEELVRLGYARSAAGRFVANRSLAVFEVWDEEGRRGAHRKIAQHGSRESSTRFVHLVRGELFDALAAEAVELGAIQAREGRLGAASATLSTALAALRGNDRGGAVEILHLWLRVALATGTTQAIDVVLYELSRLDDKDDRIRHLEDLARAGAAVTSKSAQALEAAARVAPFADIELEIWRCAMRAQAARQASLDREVEVLEEVRLAIERLGDETASAHYAGWSGRLLYRQGRFDEAVAAHRRAIGRKPWVSSGLSDTLNCGSALLEALRLDEALEIAESAMATARVCRLPLFEARAEWLARAARYRRGESLSVDGELLEAVRELGVEDLKGLVAMNEASVAWRRGELEIGAALARTASSAFRATGNSAAEVLADALGACCDRSTERARELTARLLECELPRVAAQAAALLCRADPTLRPDLAAVTARLDGDVFLERSGRLEVLSTIELREELSGVGRVGS